MNKKSFVIIALFGLLFLLQMLPVSGSDVTPSYLYRPQLDPDYPQTLNVGYIMDCGQYSIRILQQPVFNKSTNYMVADMEMYYLTIRVAITNKGTEATGWLRPDSFVLQDSYLGRIYGTYSLDVAISAKTANGFHQEPFYARIGPGETLYTSLVFMAYADAQSWILTFAPFTFAEDYPLETVRFQIPRPVVQEQE